MRSCQKTVFSLLVLFLLLIAVYVLYYFNYIPHRKYTNADFGIETYISTYDKDNDGTDDQTDILKSAREYTKTKPHYKSKYYQTGYPDDEYGVCTDVVAFAMLGAGYDLMELVNEDIKNNPQMYNIDVIDKNIDFRRVDNLLVFFQNNAIELTCDLSKTEQWQGGDIVIFKQHIGIVSDKRNKDGVPFVIHNAYPLQRSYEEDILTGGFYDIVAHYRVS